MSTGLALPKIEAAGTPDGAGGGREPVLGGGLLGSCAAAAGGGASGGFSTGFVRGAKFSLGLVRGSAIKVFTINMWYSRR